MTAAMPRARIAVKITVRSPAAVAYLAQAPGELGLARAYVAGHLDVEGDMYEALARMTKAQSVSMTTAEKLRRAGPRRPEAAGAPDAAAAAGSHADPPLADWPDALQEPRRPGDLPSLRRVQPVYEWGLGPSMAYTCACYPHQDATLEEAQGYKFDLVARKLGLKAGMRVLDVGCGWGGMVMHAAREYGVRALGGHAVRSAGRLGSGRRSKREGLSGLAEVRHAGLPRRAGETGFDAGQLDRADRARRQGQPAVLLLVPARQAEGRRVAAEPLHHPAGQHPARPSASAGSSTGTSSPTASSRGLAT